MSRTRQYIYTRDSGVCWSCGNKADPSQWEADHLIPRWVIKFTGKDLAYTEKTNLAVSHSSCNRGRPCPGKASIMALVSDILLAYNQYQANGGGVFDFADVLHAILDYRPPRREYVSGSEKRPDPVL